CKENGTRESDLIHHAADIIRCWLTWFYTGNKPVVLFQVIRNLLGIKDQRSVKESKTDHHNGIDQHVPEVTVICKHPGDLVGLTECKQSWEEHDRLSEDDWHYTGAVHFQGQKLACTAKLPVANDLLGIVYRYFSYTLDQQDTSQDDSDQYSYFKDRDQDITGTG